MSSEFATFIALSLYAAAALPLLIIARLHGGAQWPAYGFGIVILLVALVQTGILGGRESVDMKALAVAPEASRCKRAFDAMIEASVVVAPPKDGELVVNGEIWDQLPAPIQEAVLTCAQQSIAEGSTTTEVEIIKR